MKRSYTILRDVNAEVGGSKYFWSRYLPSHRTIEPLPDIERVEVDESELGELMYDLDVEAVSPVMPTKLIAPTDMGVDIPAGDSWGIAGVGADKTTFTGVGVSVGILDSGIDKTHEAFTGVQIEERDFSGDGNGDVNGHGTHCAGTVFGRDVEGHRIGVARGVENAYIGKVISDDGNGETQWLFDGILWALRKGVKVISLSLGFDVPGFVSELVSDGWPVDLATSMGLDSYIQNIRLFDRLMGMIRAGDNGGPIVIAAAGNESKRSVGKLYRIGASFPAAADHVIAVGAVSTDPTGLAIAPFSNINVRVVAPGVDICSAQPGGGLATSSGTSMACPHVAGVAALWWESVRKSSIPATSSNVMVKLIANAREDGFVPDVSAIDRGVGIVAAP